MANPTPLSTGSTIRRVWLGQMLFSAGHALTTGGFLSYFTNPYFRGFSLAFAIFQVTPEAAESLSIVTRWIVHRLGHPRQVWWGALLLARVFALVIPGLVLLGGVPGRYDTMLVIIIGMGMWYLFQGISFTAYLSWLSAEIPEINWGRMLASRSVAISLVTIIMTWTASQLVDWTVRELGWNRELVYPFLFVAGGSLCLLSIVPLLPIGRSNSAASQGDQRPASPCSKQPSFGMLLRLTWKDVPFRNFLLGSWHLAFFQGLTQTAQFQLSKEILHVSLSDYYSMVSLMLLLQIPLAVAAGWLCERDQEYRIMICGLPGLSVAMLFWVLAGLYGPVYLWAAYVVWGGFGLVNVAQPCLGLKLAPRIDNALHLSLVRPIGGLLAALSGMLGGAVLDRFSQESQFAPRVVYMTLFIVSGIGRATAAVWFVRSKPHRQALPRTEDT